MVRYKCSCGHVMNTEFGAYCEKCKQPLNIPEDGMIYLYRKGSPLGIAGGFGIYINGEPYGHIGNKESLHIPVPYGTHRLHIACGMNRRCNDLLIEISPNQRHFCAKVWMKPGFWTNSFVLEVADRSEMPSTMYIEKYSPSAGTDSYEQPVKPIQQQPLPEPVKAAPAEKIPAPTEVKKFCTNCGHKLTPDMKFCQECGTKLY